MVRSTGTWVGCVLYCMAVLLVVDGGAVAQTDSQVYRGYSGGFRLPMDDVCHGLGFDGGGRLFVSSRFATANGAFKGFGVFGGDGKPVGTIWGNPYTQSQETNSDPQIPMVGDRFQLDWQDGLFQVAVRGVGDRKLENMLIRRSCKTGQLDGDPIGLPFLGSQSLYSGFWHVSKKGHVCFWVNAGANLSTYTFFAKLEPGSAEFQFVKVQIPTGYSDNMAKYPWGGLDRHTVGDWTVDTAGNVVWVMGTWVVWFGPNGTILRGLDLHQQPELRWLTAECLGVDSGADGTVYAAYTKFGSIPRQEYKGVVVLTFSGDGKYTGQWIPEGTAGGLDMQSPDFEGPVVAPDGRVYVLRGKTVGYQ